MARWSIGYVNETKNDSDRDYIPISDVRLNEAKHLLRRLRHPYEDTVIDLEQAEQLKDLPWFRGNLIDTDPPQASQPKIQMIKVIRGIIPFTIEPAHLFLDLRVLAFIEASRTAPLEGTRHHTSQSKLTAGPASEISPPRVSTPSNIRDPSAEADGDAHLNRLLQHVYELYDCAQALEDPKERAAYQDELSRVSTLLAYKVPEHSRLSKYFGQERRQAVADEINSAILCEMSRPSLYTYSANESLIHRSDGLPFDILLGTGCPLQHCHVELHERTRLQGPTIGIQGRRCSVPPMAKTEPQLDSLAGQKHSY